MNRKKCFVITAIGDAGSKIRKDADDVIKKIIKPAFKSFSYQVERSDRIRDNKILIQRIFDCITESDIIIADLSGNNKNVWYELGIAHSLYKPVIHIMSKNEIKSLPFDAKHLNVTPYNISAINFATSINEIKSKIKSFENKETRSISNPLTNALCIQNTNHHLKLFEKILNIDRVKFVSSFTLYCDEGLNMLNNKPSKHGIITFNTPVNIKKSKRDKDAFYNYINRSINIILKNGFIYKRLIIIRNNIKTSLLFDECKRFIDAIYRNSNSAKAKDRVFLGFINENEFSMYKNIDFHFTSDNHFSIAFLSFDNPDTFGVSLHCNDIDNLICHELQQEINSFWNKNVKEKYTINSAINKDTFLKKIKDIIKQIAI